MAISDPPKPPRKVIALGGFLRDVKRPTAVVMEAEYYQGVPESQNRIQSIVDLVMWRDIPRSALVFGIGSFLLLSSSYAQDLNFSFVSAISYLGLVYLAAIFFYKSLIRRCRGAEDREENEQSCMVGEEEAIWLARLLLPYVNEVLLKLKALFSGEPTTTMKMGAMLFVLARCGGAITFRTMAKLAFFGLFTIPKICSSHSSQLAQYGKFWTERVRDAWESCQHKKAVAAAVFALFWNFSSTVARVWAGFMLAVALRLYQEHLAAMDAVAEAEDVYEGGEAEQHLPPRQQAAEEDAKQRAGGASRGRAAAGAGQVASPQRGPGRAHRQPGGPGPAREKKWS